MPKGSSPKTQGTPHTNDRGLRPGIILGRFTKTDLEDLEREGPKHGKGAEMNEVYAAIRAAKKYLNYQSEHIFYLVYEVASEVHLAPMEHSIANSLKELSLRAAGAIGKWIYKTGSLFSSQPVEEDRDVSSEEKLDRKSNNPEENWDSMAGCRCGLTSDASGGTIISELYFGNSDEAESEQGEQ